MISDQSGPPSPVDPVPDASMRSLTGFENPTTPALDLSLDSLQHELDSLKEQLTESQRLATVGTIAAVIAHEFNNLLTPIASYCQLALNAIEAKKDDPELIKKALTKSVHHAMRAGKISTSMLSLVRGERENKTVSIQTLIDESLAVLARDPQKDGIALRVQVQPDLVVKGDPVQLEQVMLNLLINARQAMLGEERNRGNSITIKADRTDQNQIRISVIDTGPGIAAKNLAKVFEPFFTTKTAPRPGEHRGSGLGLHICKKIVAVHGGEITAESTQGKGTTFTLMLPAA
jgi:two-component system, NtrC family, sensor kinase